MNVKSADVKSVSECSRLFLKGNSPFSQCFYYVNPDSYFTHCISNRSNIRGGKMKDELCGAVTAYLTQCLAQGISLPYLDKCKKGEYADTMGHWIKFMLYCFID